jgi:hypothetical protein
LYKKLKCYLLPAGVSCLYNRVRLPDCQTRWLGNIRGAPRGEVRGNFHMIGTLTTHLLQALFAISYVSSIYLHPNGRLHFKPTSDGRIAASRSRNDPVVIKTRLIAVTLATLASCTIVFLVIWKDSNDPSDVRLPDVLFIRHSCSL